MNTIIKYEKLLIDLKKEVAMGKRTKKEYETLYNKKTALQSRLNKKTQKIEAQETEE